MARGAIVNGTVVTMDGAGSGATDGAGRIVERGAVVFEDGAIVSVGHDPLPAGLAPESVIDATGCAVIPGLINAHTHLYNTFGRTLSADQSFDTWLPTQKGLIAQLDENDFALCVTLGLVENLRSGNTCVVDNPAVPSRSADRLYDVTIGIARALGARLVLARGYTDQMNAPDYLESLPEIEARLRALVRAHHGTAGGRIQVMASPMLPWALSPEGFLLTRRLADDLGVRIHMHTAETAGFAPLIEKAHGHRSNTRVYRDGGCLGPDVQLLGCTCLEAEEIDVIRDTGTAVILDPSAAMYIGAGMPPLTALLATGGPVALATNGSASNGSQDMFESMKNAAGLARIAARHGAALTQRRALEIATIEGARALGLDGQIGSIAPGKRADLAVVDLATAFAAPSLNVVTALVSSCKSRDVRDVVVDGHVVVRDRRALGVDEADLVARATDAARRAVGRAGLGGRTSP
jgi:5-methylthioadenosine/S-adenosylhomocysteine deaminase